MEGVVFGQPDDTFLLFLPSLLKELVLSGPIPHSEIDAIAKIFNDMSSPEANEAADFVARLKDEKPKTLLTLCDLNQNIISSLEIPMLILQGLDSTLAELVENVMQEELMARAAEVERQFEGGLKLNFFKTLQNWVHCDEDRKLDSRPAQIEGSKAGPEKIQEVKGMNQEQV